MSSDIDTYFERLDELERINRDIVSFNKNHERGLRGRWDKNLRPIAQEEAPRLVLEEDILRVENSRLYHSYRKRVEDGETHWDLDQWSYGYRNDNWDERTVRCYRLPWGDYAPPNWLEQRSILRESRVWYSKKLDELLGRKNEFQDIGKFWKLCYVIASRCSKEEESENFRRKYERMLTEDEEEASRLLDEIRDALEPVAEPYDKVLTAWHSPRNSRGNYILDFRWPIDGNSPITFLRGLFNRWSLKSGSPHEHEYLRRHYRTSGGREIPRGRKPNMISWQGVEYLLRGNAINTLSRVEVARLLHARIPYLINRLKRCYAFRMKMDLVRGKFNEENNGLWARKLKEKFEVFSGVDDDGMDALVTRSIRQMTFPGIHAMAVEPSLAPTIESMEEELYFRVRLELFIELNNKSMSKWRYGLNMGDFEFTEYINDEREKRDDENDGLLDAGVNVDLIEAYKDIRIEKIDMLKLDKKHKKLENDGSFHWILELEDDLMHLFQNLSVRRQEKLIFENEVVGSEWSRQGNLNTLRWHALCEPGFNASYKTVGDSVGTCLRDYLWKNKKGYGSGFQKSGGKRLVYEDAEAYVVKATKFLGIAGGFQELLSIEKPLERFDAILGPYIEIDSKISGLVEHMMDEDNEYSSETYDIVRRILDGKMGEEERQLLTSLVDGETAAGYAFDADILYEWVERWDLLDYPEALGEVLAGADFDAVAVKHGLMQ